MDKLHKYKSSLLAMVFWIVVLWLLTFYKIEGWRFINFNQSVNEVKNILTNSETLKAIAYTLAKLIEYFIKITLMATTIAILSYKFKIINDLLSPLITAFKSIPVVASILLIYLIFESTNVGFIIVFLMAFPVLYSAFKESLDKIPSTLIRHNKVHDVSVWKQITKLFLPLLFFKNKVIIISVIGLSLKSLIAAEILTSTTTGVGFEINTARQLLDINLLFAWLTVLTMIIIIIDIGFKKLMRVGDHNE